MGDFDFSAKIGKFFYSVSEGRNAATSSAIKLSQRSGGRPEFDKRLIGSHGVSPSLSKNEPEIAGELEISDRN